MIVYVLINNVDISSIHSTKQSANDGLKSLKRSIIKDVRRIVKDEDDSYTYANEEGIIITFSIKEFVVVEPKTVYRGTRGTAGW